MSYYDYLKIPPMSNIKDIKTAYKKLAKIYHPDKSVEFSNGENFKMINQAYTILSDKSERLKYDTTLKQKRRGAWKEFLNILSEVNPSMVSIALEYLNHDTTVKNNQIGEFIIYIKENFNSLKNKYQLSPYVFVDMINELYHKILSLNKKPKNKDIVIKLRVSLEEAYYQNIKQYTVKRYRLCPACHGYSIIRACDDCGRDCSDEVVCKVCFSWDVVESQCKRCKDVKCKKKGFYICKKKYQIPLIQDSIRYIKNGDESVNTKEAGDLVFRIVTKPHPIFKVYQFNLLIVKQISLYEWLYGIDFNITHLNGKPIRIYYKGHIKFPIYIVEGMGMPRKNGGYGNLLIYLKMNFNSIDREMIYKIAPPIDLLSEKIDPAKTPDTVEGAPYLTENEEDIIEFAKAFEDTDTVDSITIL